MEAQVSEILENILSLLSLEGSFEVNEKEDGVFVTIDTQEAGKLIGHQGETLTALQLLVNQIVFKQMSNSTKVVVDDSADKANKKDKANAESVQVKRVIIDVSDWRRGKEEELAHRARSWAQEVNESGQEMELDPMTIEGTDGVVSESVGEGLDRHLIIRPGLKEGLKEKAEDVASED